MEEHYSKQVNERIHAFCGLASYYLEEAKNEKNEKEKNDVSY